MIILFIYLFFSYKNTPFVAMTSVLLAWTSHSDYMPLIIDEFITLLVFNYQRLFNFFVHPPLIKTLATSVMTKAPKSVSCTLLAHSIE